MKKLINTKKDPSLMGEKTEEKRRITIISPPLRITDSFWLRNLIECPIKEWIRRTTGNTLAPLTHFAEIHDAYLSLLYPNAEREVEVTYNNIKGKIDAVVGNYVIEHKRISTPLSPIFASHELLTAFSTGMQIMLSSLEKIEPEVKNDGSIYDLIKPGCESKYPFSIGCSSYNLFGVQLYAKDFYRKTHHMIRENLFQLNSEELAILAEEIKRSKQINGFYSITTFATASLQAIYYSILLEEQRGKKYEPIVSLTITPKTRVYPVINTEYHVSFQNINKSYFIDELNEAVEIAKNPKQARLSSITYFKTLPCSQCDYRAVCKFRKNFERYDKYMKEHIEGMIRFFILRNASLKTEVLFMNTP
jgi:CRISPR/Cas system-associated exonuclease Cas4 (RecB family)